MAQHCEGEAIGVNFDKKQRWEEDILKSVDMYNNWFMNFAPDAFRTTRIQTTKDVEAALRFTNNLTDISPQILRRYPGILPTLRMATCPPIASDRLIGLAKVSANLVERMEKDGKLPPRMSDTQIDVELAKIGTSIQCMADPDIFVWLGQDGEPTEMEVYRAATIVADRLCGSVANPIIRNAQEKRQLAAIKAWLEERGYREIYFGERASFDAMLPGTFSFRLNVPVNLEGGTQVNIPVDAVIMPFNARPRSMPLLFEAKSAGDFTNVNKRRKEEAVKMVQLRNTYGPRLKDFFRITRGLATGDNAFFILTPEQIEAHSLPWECFRPILPSPRYLEQEEVYCDDYGIPSNIKKLFLLDCRLPEEEIKNRYPTLWSYLQTGKPEVSERYLCSKRKPWYSQEERPPSPFVCTYLGRSGTKRGKTFRFILNHSRATAANVYLLLYPKIELVRAFEADSNLMRRVWEWLNTIQPDELLDEGRVYGGGLYKMEPNELANVRADGLQALLGTPVTTVPESPQWSQTRWLED